MTIPAVCDKCKSLRGVEVPTPLEVCKEKMVVSTWNFCCEYHHFMMYDMCKACFAFIQDPKNDKQLQEWESQHGKAETNT